MRHAQRPARARRLARWFAGTEAGAAAASGHSLGHLFPVWLGFKGGKGVATYIRRAAGAGVARRAGVRRGVDRGRGAQPLLVAGGADGERGGSGVPLAHPRQHACTPTPAMSSASTTRRARQQQSHHHHRQQHLPERPEHDDAHGDRRRPRPVRRPDGCDQQLVGQRVGPGHASRHQRQRRRYVQLGDDAVRASDQPVVHAACPGRPTASSRSRISITAARASPSTTSTPPTTVRRKYRQPFGVDIQTTTDTGGGYNIGYTKAGEWLQYTMDIAAAGTYNLDVRVAGTAPAASSTSSSTARTSPARMSMLNTGGTQTWKTLTKAASSSPPGGTCCAW